MTERDIVGVSRSQLLALMTESDTLAALEESGVDNWGFYGDAMDSRSDEESLRHEVDGYDAAITRDDTDLFFQERGLEPPSCAESVHQMDRYQVVAAEFMEHVLTRLSGFNKDEDGEDD